MAHDQVKGSTQLPAEGKLDHAESRIPDTVYGYDRRLQVDERPVL